VTTPDDARNEREAQPSPGAEADERERIVANTRKWLERAVIGLALCPFARGVHVRDVIRYSISEQRTPGGLVDDLARELEALHAADPAACETTLLIHPYVLNDFDDYNQFLGEADALLVALGFDGELQIASFHPEYRFAGTASDDITNYTNRSPYPLLHLLRESSVTRAVATFAAVDEIGERNTRTLRELGLAGWRALLAGD
jgi:hypothetical protein